MYENKLITLNDSLISSLKSCEVVKIHEKEVNSLDFSNDGNYLITSGKDDLITVFEIERREIVRKLYNRTYGCENAIFTHNSRAILCSSNKDFRIMYWCLHNNEILFSFLGHSDLITDITINPHNDTFLTTSRDKTSRLWDLHKRTCLCIFQDSNHATFDSTGEVIASVTCETIKNTERSINFINLYSTECIVKGPFKVFKLDNTSEIKQLKFSNNGSYICCVTNDNLILVVEAYDGNILKRLTGEINEGDIYFKIDISADSQYLASGTDNGNILIWNIDKGELVANLAYHPLPTNCVKFSPRQAILASSCVNYIIWHPSMDINEIK